MADVTRISLRNGVTIAGRNLRLLTQRQIDKFMNHLSARLHLSLQKAFSLVRKKAVSSTILGRRYTLIQGTHRQNPDYDDAWLLALAHEAQNVYDVGCNIGQSSLLLLWPANVQNIVLIEPNPSALSICAENLILNGLSQKARFVCAIASEKAGDTSDLFTVGSGAAGSMFEGH